MNKELLPLFLAIPIIVLLPVLSVLGITSLMRAGAPADKIRSQLEKLYSRIEKTGKGPARDELIDQFFGLAKQAYSVAEGTRRHLNAEWRKAARELEDFLARRSVLVQRLASQTTVPVSEEIEKLALLRSEGIISDHEFQAFSERFTVSTGEKARGIIAAISDLHDQYKTGGMSEGNYHAGLWSLLDKLDRRT